MVTSRVHHAPIDIVIPHVDGTAPGFAAAHAEHAGAMTPCQLRDNGELRYVLRSIHDHAPWVRRVHLAVMDDGHVPAWVQRAHVHVVHHRSFIPAARLPTFHGQSICAHVHRIDGLAERFIFTADDGFLGRPTQPSDFFCDTLPRLHTQASPILPMARWLARNTGAFMAHALATRAALKGCLQQHGVGIMTRTLGHCLFAHGPKPMMRSLWRQMLSQFATDAAVQSTLAQRTRQDRAQTQHYVLLDHLFCNWVQHVHRRQHAFAMLAQCCRAAGARLWRRVSGRGDVAHATYGVFNNPHTTQRHMQRLLRQRPQRFCINDEAYDCHRDASGHWHRGWHINPASLKVMHQTLQQLFPTPSKFERAE